MIRALALKSISLTALLGVCSVVPAQPSSPGGTIHILVLNGNSGKPLPYGTNGTTKVGMGLFVSPVCTRSAACSAAMQRMGGPVDGAGRMEFATFDGLTALDLMRPSSYFRYCQGVPDAHGELDKTPRFSVEEILRVGVVAPNSCNERLHIKPVPGQLVFFLRPLTMWESLTKPPQM